MRGDEKFPHYINDSREGETNSVLGDEMADCTDRGNTKLEESTGVLEAQS